MRKKGFKKVTTLRPYVNFDFLPSKAEDIPNCAQKEAAPDEEEEMVNPEVSYMARRIEREGFDTVLKELDKSWAENIEQWKVKFATEEKPNKNQKS